MTGEGAAYASLACRCRHYHAMPLASSFCYFPRHPAYPTPSISPPPPLAQGSGFGLFADDDGCWGCPSWLLDII